MTARCRRPKCGRPLRTEQSVRRGYGPVCWRREHPTAARPAADHPADPDQIPLPLEAPVQHTLIVERSTTGENAYRGTCSCDGGFAWLSLAGLGGLETPWREHLTGTQPAPATSAT